MVSQENIEAIRARYKSGDAESQNDIETLFLALEEKQQEIDRAFEALGTTQTDCADDSDVADLAGAIRASLTYERDISSQLREDLIKEGEQRPEGVTVPFGLVGPMGSLRVEPFLCETRLSYAYDRGGFIFCLNAEQTRKLREALRLVLERI